MDGPIDTSMDEPMGDTMRQDLVGPVVVSSPAKIPIIISEALEAYH